MLQEMGPSFARAMKTIMGPSVSCTPSREGTASKSSARMEGRALRLRLPRSLRSHSSAPAQLVTGEICARTRIAGASTAGK